MRERTVLGPTGLDQFFLLQNVQFSAYILYIQCKIYQYNLKYMYFDFMTYVIFRTKICNMYMSMYTVEHMLKTQNMLITYLRFYPEETAEMAARRAFASDAEDWNSIPSRNIP